MRDILFAAILLSVLDILLEPIAIWMMPYLVLGPWAALGVVVLFPVCAWLVLLLLPTDTKRKGRRRTSPQLTRRIA